MQNERWGEGNLVTAQTEIVESKKSIYELLKKGEFQNAEEAALKAMGEEISDPDFGDMLKCISFWQKREDCFHTGADASHGEKLYNEWERFLDFCEESKIENKKSILAIKTFVFKTMVDLLIETYRLSPIKDRETLLYLGYAFSELGMSDKAIETLEYAIGIGQDDSNDIRIYLLLGDLYAETNELDYAMVMYNEAFFRQPQMVPIDSVGFAQIHNLKKLAAKDGFGESEIPEWIPVYGYIYNGLTARRQMEQKEYMALQQRIKDYEKSLEIDKKVIHIIVPRLINYYVWFFDYYVFTAKAYKGAEKIINRVDQLYDYLICPEDIRTKLRERTFMVFKKILEKARGF